MTLSEKLKTAISRHIHGAGGLSVPVASAQVCESYFNDAVVIVSHDANTAGVIFDAHKHENNHIAICCGGESLFSVEGQEDVLLTNGGTCLVPAGKTHSVIAVSGCPVVLCVFTQGYD